MPSEKSASASKPKKLITIDWNELGFRAVMPVMAMLVALLIGAVVLLFLKVNPFEAYAAIVSGVFGSMSGFRTYPKNN